ncbi:Bro-N domain-containing protein [Campylobacter helveticus]|uniref:BRO-N domain-containing protein n=1 Tax=Campylobacter helveticus TaxID=28898 RepID=UPI002149EC52|nr:BRO family protein [Campylobacter helveticus]MCR2061733.1 BRO family protein [Campylobacter helveticus]
MIFQYLKFENKNVRVIVDDNDEIMVCFLDIVALLKLITISHYRNYFRNQFGEEAFRIFLVKSANSSNKANTLFTKLEYVIHLAEHIHNRKMHRKDTAKLQAWLKALPELVKQSKITEKQIVRETKQDFDSVINIEVVEETTIPSISLPNQAQIAQAVENDYPKCNGFFYKNYELDIMVIYEKIFFALGTVKAILRLDNDTELLYFLQSFTQEELEKAKFRTFKESSIKREVDEIYVELKALKSLIYKLKTQEALEFLKCLEKNIIPNLKHNYLQYERTQEDIARENTFLNYDNSEDSLEKAEDSSLKSNQLIFQREGQEIRIIKDESGEPLFCLRDICDSLGHSNSRVIKEAIQNEFQGSNFNLHPFQTQGGIQHFTMITEPQLYFMLMRSDKPKARDFRQWVINEVLPSIRKSGAYSVNSKENHHYEKAPAHILSHKESLKLALEYLDKSEALRIENEQLKLENERLRKVFDRGGSLLFTQLAKVCHIEEDELRKVLLGYNIISYFDKKMIATAYAIEKGYAKMKLTDSRPNMYVQVVFSPKTVKNIEIYKIEGLKEDLF